MTDEELLEAFLSGELDAEGQDRLDALLERRPELVRVLIDHLRLNGALQALLGDGSDDVRMVESVISDLGGESYDEFKTHVLEAIRVPERETAVTRPMRRVVTKRRWVPWAAGIAAALALAAVTWPRPAPPAPAAAFVREVPETREVHETEVPPSRDNAVARLSGVQGDVFRLDRTPIRGGMPVGVGQGIITEGLGSRAVVEYPDGTVVEIGPDTVVLRLANEKGDGKEIALDKGSVNADVVKQPAGHPLEVVSPQARARVVGTRFTFTSNVEGARLQVEEGVVRFTRVQDGRLIDVRSGYAATASAGAPFQAVLVPGGTRYLDLDVTSGYREGDGSWAVEGRAIRQCFVQAGGAQAVFPVNCESSVVLETVVHVDAAAMGKEWGFGLVAGFPGRTVVLRTIQGGLGGSMLEFKGGRGLPFEHGREGTYRLKFEIDRRAGAPTVLRGKLWQGDREPDGWIIEDEVAVEGPLTSVGLHAVRCVSAFSRFRGEVARERY